MRVVCVWVRGIYGPEYVYGLRDGVRRHLPYDHEFVCLTDRPSYLSGIDTVDVSEFKLEGWWNKMLVFNRDLVPGPKMYIDLDDVIVGTLSPLYDRLMGLFPVDYALCYNFTRLRGNATWPCNLSSTVMLINAGFGHEVWQEFDANRDHYVGTCFRGGDQLAIERIVDPRVVAELNGPRGSEPWPGYFLHYKDLREERDPRASIVVFGGTTKPHNTHVDWVRKEWER